MTTRHVYDMGIVGNCSYFSGYGNMHPGDHCRALGNALSIGLHATSVANIVNNTITSEGDCLVLSGSGGTTAQLNLSNNVLLGQVDWRQPWESSCVHYSDGGLEKVTWSRNLVSGVKNGNCPAGSLCMAPLLANATLTGFDATPLAASPLLDVASATLAPSDDLRRNLRPSGAGPDIGAVELGAAGAPAPSPDPAPAPAPTPEPAPAPAPAPAPTLLLHVQSVNVVRTVKGQWSHYSASVKVVDASGMPVADARVAGDWTGAGITAASAVTDAAGMARLDGGRSKLRTRATLCVSSVRATGYDAGSISVCGAGG